MTNFDPEILKAALRQDLSLFTEKTFGTVSPGATYLDNWHIDAITHKLMEVEKGKNKRLIINIPPRHLKSIAVSVAFAAYLLGHDPTRKIICASYGEVLAVKHSLDCRTVMTSPWYQKLFPGTVLSGEKFTNDFFGTTEKGFRMATSVGGPLTGLGGDLIIIDDPMKPADAASELERKKVNDWFSGTVLSRLNDKTKGAIVLIMQRLHEDDLTGHLRAQGGWDLLSIPAEAPFDLTYRTGPDEADTHRFARGSVIDPVREPKETLAELRHAMGSRAYSAQYLQSPVPAGGNLLDWSWFKFYDPASLDPAQIHFVFQSWDIATSQSDAADYSVCTTWGVTYPNRYYLLDLVRRRCSFPDLIRLALVLAEMHKVDAIVAERVGIGEGFCQQLHDILGERVVHHRPTRDKVVRTEAISPIIEAGKVLLPHNAKWLEDFRNEILAFPMGKHDDQVDSMVQFLEYVPKLMGRVHYRGLSRRGGSLPPLPRGGTVIVRPLMPPRPRDRFI